MLEAKLRLHARIAVLASTIFVSSNYAAFATSPLEAAQDLARNGESDPNGMTLMIVSICMLFVFALSLIIATSVHAFKKKPSRKPTLAVSKETTSTVA